MIVNQSSGKRAVALVLTYGLQNSRSPLRNFSRAAQKAGHFAMRRGDYQGALQAYSTALKAGDGILSDEHKSMLYSARSMAYLGASDVKRAGADAALSVELDPKSIKARVRCLRCLPHPHWVALTREIRTEYCQAKGTLSVS